MDSAGADKDRIVPCYMVRFTTLYRAIRALLCYVLLDPELENSDLKFQHFPIAQATFSRWSKLNRWILDRLFVSPTAQLAVKRVWI